MLVSHLVDEWLSERSVKLGPASRKQYDSEMQRFLGYLDEHEVTSTDRLTLPVLVGYVAWLQEVPHWRGGVRASKTVMTYYKTVMCLLRWAVDAEYLPQRVLKLPAPRLEKRIPATLSHDDTLRLVRAAGGSGKGGAMQARDTAIAWLLLDTGLRASELCSLALDDVHLDEGYVLVRHGKGDRWRQVGPLGARTVRALKTYRNQWRPKLHPTCDAFFVSRKGGGQLRREALGDLTTRLKRKAGVDGRVHPHAFRHSYARSQAEAGADVLAISRLLGHSSLAITQTYLQAFTSVDARRRVGSVVDTL